MTAPDVAKSEEFDFVFTRLMAEHVRDGRTMHGNIYALLKPGGIAAHFFPTLYALPFVVNRIVPEAIASHLVDVFSPRDRHQHAKFPAQYSWCRGPTRRALQQLTGLGYDVIEYNGFFGHGRYYRKMPFIQKTHDRASAFLLQHPMPYLTSYAYVILRKPPAGNG